MFSEEYRGWRESAFPEIGRAQLDNLNTGTADPTLPQPPNVDVSPMSDAAHSSDSHTVYSQLPTPTATPGNPSNPPEHPTSTIIVHPKRQEKTKSKRKRHISEYDDDVNEDIIEPGINPDVPRFNTNRPCVHSLPHRIFLGH